MIIRIRETFAELAAVGAVVARSSTVPFSAAANWLRFIGSPAPKVNDWAPLTAVTYTSALALPLVNIIRSPTRTSSGPPVLMSSPAGAWAGSATVAVCPPTLKLKTGTRVQRRVDGERGHHVRGHAVDVGPASRPTVTAGIVVVPAGHCVQALPCGWGR